MTTKPNAPRRRRGIRPVVAGCCLFAVFAGVLFAAAADPGAATPDPPRSAGAAAALARQRRAVSDAEQKHRQALLAAEDRLIADLETALEAALKGRDLKEANRINAAIESATDRARSRRAPGKASGRGPAADLVGTWRVFYTSGDVPTIFHIGPRDDVKTEDGRAGKLRREGDQILVDVNDGRLDRITPLVDGRLVFEHYMANHDLKNPTRTIGIGRREGKAKAGK